MKLFFRILALLAFIICWNLNLSENPLVARTLALVFLVAILWFSEAIPLAVAALLPLLVAPLAGIASSTQVAAKYFNATIFLFLGGFFMAIAMETWGLHRRMALFLLRYSGKSAPGLLAGFMGSAFFLSMWISNTATALLMLPLALAVCEKQSSVVFASRLFLGVAYSCSMGGMATLTGTPPNLILAEHLSKLNQAIAFNEWMLFGLPVALTMLLFTWIWLAWPLFKIPPIPVDSAAAGSLSGPQRRVFILFALLAVLWIGRADIDFGAGTLPGWSRLLVRPDLINDATVAIAIAVLLFIIPAGSAYPGKHLLDAEAFQRIPWQVVVLFGGGFALSFVFETGGLSGWLSSSWGFLDGLPQMALIGLIAFAVSLVTEFISNTALVQIALPVLQAVATASGIPPLFLLLPATLSASMAFMMPVGTPPNLIFFSSGRIKLSEMIRAGFVLDVVGVCSVLLWMYLLKDALAGFRF